MSDRLFGEHRTRVGWPNVEWSVWINATDDNFPQDTLTGALLFAATHNAAFADMHVRHGDTDVTMYAVVLHWGYAWTPETEHAHGIHCGMKDCYICNDYTEQDEAH